MIPTRCLVVPALISCALVLIGCGGSRELDHRRVQVSALEEQLGDLHGQLRNKEARIRDLENREPEVIVQKDDSAARDLAGLGADVFWRNGELVISITNDILFTAGSAKLSGTARTTLGRVVGVIRNRYPSQYVRVEGHTDSDPIKRSKKHWDDNWHLSGARARAVLHELINLGIDKGLIGFAGYGPVRPVGSNSSRSGKAQNRRVEIIVLPPQPR